jgi:polyphosphate glucokinase
MSNLALGVDVGGSSIKYALVDVSSGRLVDEARSVLTPQPATGDALMSSIGELGRAAPAGAGLGVALPSVVRFGVAHTAANLHPSLIGTNVEQVLGGRLQRAVACLNDADAAGLAEVRWGAARDVRGTVMVLTFGTGIGSALFVDGKLVPNTELGHMEVGGFEAEKRASARARSDEGLSWAQWSERVNQYLDAINALFWPELIVMGGGVSESFGEYSALLSSRAPVKPATLGAAAGVVGAAMAVVR